MVTLRIFSFGEQDELRQLERMARKTANLQSRSTHKESITGRVYSEIPVSLGQIAKSVDEQGHNRMTILLGDNCRENHTFDLILVPHDAPDSSDIKNLLLKKPGSSPLSPDMGIEIQDYYDNEETKS